MINYSETQSIEIENDFQLKILVKREDQNHPFVSGNKWWKLKYNLEEAKIRGQDTLLTFGGAFSNHIYATAAASKQLGYKCIGVIRGERVEPLNATLSFAESCGTKLHFVYRSDYKKKNSKEFIENLHALFGDFYLLPEGGTNALAIKGCAEFAQEKLWPIESDYVCLPVGTGGTMAGIILGMHNKRKVIGFSVLKNGEFLNKEINECLEEALTIYEPAQNEDFETKEFSNWLIQTNYHFGGYAKTTPALLQFIDEMKGKGLPLDQVYTAKMMIGIFDLAKKNFFHKGSTVLAIHTGGLQGAFH